MGKPTEEEILHYKERLEHYLKIHDLGVEAIIRDEPFKMKFWSGKEPTDYQEIWLRGVNIKNHKIEQPEGLFVPLYIKNIFGKDEKDIWGDAHEIQNAYYNYLKITPKNPQEGDIYWELWDLFPRD